ncbi:Rieske (2Fe-2S) protein [Pseudomonas sp. 910_23]|uniref:Rieske (2Fe-2S) protein n=1 Tax=Pseudomonas synxantha TaxID=47883 RepID=A0A5D3GF09_9PSED|nr:MULTISPECIES: Rieske (2Fe-2S) protein [unclassified Pseudomonas]TYK54272.1 Rieske (2Fe-2S) protein [Pseudomonas synxantha]MCK3826273.1 Rieske (2Fe-2S) protein [Pseudomonas sp. W2Aug9]MCK3842361.1 Rieske (2Fe-2S) protein [Pseudomonas sp. W15Feb34]MCK3865961.1 Rieske (2Fe-2S) protein [Pseudomonas sp. B329]TYK59577.1 Rieske (2Fe-2S) protein [Pseudomonas synxantha]
MQLASTVAVSTRSSSGSPNVSSEVVKASSPLVEHPPACQFAAKRDALEEGGTLAVQVEGQAILLCQARQAVYAVENRCPHQGKTMDGALIRRGQLICPHHGARFDLETGEALGPHTRCALTTYKVHLIDSDVMIEQRAQARPECGT